VQKETEHHIVHCADRDRASYAVSLTTEMTRLQPFSVVVAAVVVVLW